MRYDILKFTVFPYTFTFYGIPQKGQLLPLPKKMYGKAQFLKCNISWPMPAILLKIGEVTLHINSTKHWKFQVARGNGLNSL